MPNAPIDTVRSLTVLYDATPSGWYVDANAASAPTPRAAASGLRSAMASRILARCCSGDGLSAK
jgi:hypothetical protein